MEHYHVIGIMSGTSLDGLDLAYCSFTRDNGWTFRIDKAQTIPYAGTWKERLKMLMQAPAEELVRCDVEYGQFIASHVNRFIEDFRLKPDFLSSHGHTVFHNPKEGYTCQIGNGNVMAALTGLPVVYNFRSLDVALGGQGAPLVPVGDRILFAEYEYCLNLGGFANISFEKDDQRVAYDICPVNIVLNELANEAGHAFDPNGEIARSGSLVNDLLTRLNNLEFYNEQYPKSLGREWVVQHIVPLFKHSKNSLQDKLHTFTVHIAEQIARQLNLYPEGRVLISGGGAHNSFLLENLRAAANSTFVIPDRLLIDYKEALVFAFLGILHLRGELNCLKSVTGARADSSSGLVAIPPGSGFYEN